jgi:hypothetical protein
VDPGETLRQIRSTLRTPTAALTDGEAREYLDLLADQVSNLDEWLGRGGFARKEMTWQRNSGILVRDKQNCSHWWDHHQGARRISRMSYQIRQIVEQTWREHIGLPSEWTPQQITTFLDREAGAICRQIEARMGTAQGPAVARWKAGNPGQEPDYPTLTALINTGRNQITEEVLTEALYDKIPIDHEPSHEEVPGDPVNTDMEPANRWRFPTARTPEPDADLEELADRLLPMRSTLVRVMAAHLLQTMREDGLPLPDEEDVPAMLSFMNRLESGMTADGQPLDGPGALVETR